MASFFNPCPDCPDLEPKCPDIGAILWVDRCSSHGSVDKDVALRVRGAGLDSCSHRLFFVAHGP